MESSSTPSWSTYVLFVSLYNNVLTCQTPRGSELLRNFSVDICGAKPEWKMGDFVQQEIARIRALVGDRAQVIGAVSGGVDSTVAAKLMKEAIGDRFHAVLVDNGMCMGRHGARCCQV